LALKLHNDLFFIALPL